MPSTSINAGACSVSAAYAGANAATCALNAWAMSRIATGTANATNPRKALTLATDDSAVIADAQKLLRAASGR